jgi:hypothetical protein
MTVLPANHTATFSEILTENYSHSSQICCGISNAADRRPQTADRRPQTADRRPQTADRIYKLSS